MRGKQAFTRHKRLHAGICHVLREYPAGYRLGADRQLGEVLSERLGLRLPERTSGVDPVRGGAEEGREGDLER